MDMFLSSLVEIGRMDRRNGKQQEFVSNQEWQIPFSFSRDTNHTFPVIENKGDGGRRAETEGSNLHLQLFLFLFLWLWSIQTHCLLHDVPVEGSREIGSRDEKK